MEVTPSPASRANPAQVSLTALVGQLTVGQLWGILVACFTVLAGTATAGWYAHTWFGAKKLEAAENIALCKPASSSASSPSQTALPGAASGGGPGLRAVVIDSVDVQGNQEVRDNGHLRFGGVNVSQ